MNKTYVAEKISEIKQSVENIKELDNLMFEISSNSELIGNKQYGALAQSIDFVLNDLLKNIDLFEKNIA